MGTVVYGSEIAAKVKADLKMKVEAIKASGQRLPKLVVILVGNNPASLSYVSGKEKACLEIGMANDMVRLDENTSEAELLKLIDELNHDDEVDGILVQLPLPKHMDEHKIVHAIDPSKDVDGFHPFNVGQLMLQEDTFVACTPKGIMRILESIGMKDLSGKEAVVIGRSNIVGKPVAQLLMNANATVTVCHSRTANIQEVCKRGDIVVAAIGKARYINSDWIKDGAVVIDVGINRDENNKLCGDVDFDDVVEHASYITPVPKGVGPMTIAMLMENTIESYEKKMK